MNRIVSLSRPDLLRALARSADEPAWRQRLAHLLGADNPTSLHVAVMHEPYLRLVLEGRKTIESRFSVNRICPFEAVEVGDVLALKVQSGPIVGLAEVEHAAFYELDPATWTTLRRDFAGPLCAADDDFWAQRAQARYASLLRITYPLPISPLAINKTDRRGWVCLPGAEAQQALAV